MQIRISLLLYSVFSPVQLNRFPNSIPLNLEFSSTMVGPWFNRRDRSNKLNRNGIRFFSYETLQIATNNFSTLIGRGGFGSVFKGVLPEDGRLVAIKRLNHRSTFDPDRFLEMVEYMSHLRHTNLIQVIGCCVKKDLSLLVTEYAEEGSLTEFLGDSTRSDFNWERRAGVCIGTARGLSYLHEDINPRVIHRDIKPANILLDSNFVPKIADFDLVLLVDHNSRLPVGGTGVGTIPFIGSDTEYLVCGTIGYLAPEYLTQGICTKKLDVYAFGVAMLEIISGRSSNLRSDSDRRFSDLLRYAITLRKDGKILELVDPMLVDFPKEDVERFLHVALLCAQPDSNQRPNMFEVVLMLYGVSKSNQEISEMSMRSVTTADPTPWSTHNSVPTSSSEYSLTSFTLEEEETQDGGNWTGIDDGAKVQEHNELDESLPSSSFHGSIVLNWENAAHTEQGNNAGAQSCEITDVSSYFQRSIQKIKEFQASNASNATSNGTRRMARTMVIRRVSMEAVYPPYLSGEYPPSNAFCNLRWQ